MGVEFARVECRGVDLINESIATTVNETLDEWENALALPDDCTGASSTTSERLRQINQKLLTRGSQHADYYVQIAKQLGFDITIQDFRQFRMGSRMGDRIYSINWRFFWQVDGPPTIQTKFRMGSRMGDRLTETGNPVLECTIEKHKPAHTKVIFVFSA